MFEPFTAKPNAAASQLWLEHGKPMVFAGGTRGLALDRDRVALRVVDVEDGDLSEVLVHDRTNRAIALLLVDMPFGEFPMALGVLYDDPAPTFDSAVAAQTVAASEGKVADLQKLVARGQTWMVEKEPRAG